jgi:hypothetical protein
MAIYQAQYRLSQVGTATLARPITFSITGSFNLYRTKVFSLALLAPAEVSTMFSNTSPTPSAANTMSANLASNNTRASFCLTKAKSSVASDNSSADKSKVVIS